MTTPDTNTTARVVAVAVNGTTTRVEDLPLEVVDRIAKVCDVSWLVVVAQPMSDLALAKMVLDAVAAHVEHPVPETLSVRALSSYFLSVPDTIPDDVPKIEGDGDDPDPFESSGTPT